MKFIEHKFQAYLWSFLALALQYGGALLLLPLLAHYLTPAEVGIWYACQLAYILSLLLELGCQSAFSRSISYARAGAVNLYADGIGEALIDPTHSANFPLLASVFKAIDLRYKVIALQMLLSLLTAGSLYIYFISAQYQGYLFVLGAWIIFASANVLTFYIGRRITILIGLDCVADAQRVSTVSRLGSIGGAALALILGAGLCGALVGWSVGGCLAYWPAHTLLKKNNFFFKTQGLVPDNVQEVLKIISFNGNRVGLTAIAGFIIIRGTGVLASFYLDLGEFAAYSISLQLFQAFATVARLKFMIETPRLSGFASTQQLAQFRSIFMQCLLYAWIAYFALILLFGVFGGPLLGLLNKRMPALTGISFALLAIFYLMEITHGTCALAITMFNSVPFLRASWLTAGLMLAGAFIVGAYTNWGLMGFLAVQVLSQIIYNAWKWPVVLYKRTRSL